MLAARTALLSSFAIGLTALTGCQFVAKSQLDAAEAHNRMLLEQKNAILAENENLKTHSHRLEDQVKQAEEELAALDDQRSDEQRKIIAARGVTAMPASLSKRFAQLSRTHEGMEFDDQSGASKLDTDVLFDSGKAELRADAYPLLDEFADVLKSPEARELRVMVVGHTDNRRISKRETRERFVDNWHLASARALAVAEYLQSRGVREEQLGMTAFGKHQPIASNQTAADRQRNRRVEIFVTGPNAPIVGWTDTKTDLY
ncbi:MAG TPA: OmpA family protein [Pirellulales bacterium]|nr:OmpA family protein [Pirellulales bacterium]